MEEKEAGKKRRPAKEKPKKEPKKEQKKETKHREENDAAASVRDEMNAAFRKRLLYLMNGNNTAGKSVTVQELADAVGVSRPAIRKYLKPRDRGEPTTPSSATVCAIARFFDTTPDFLLGFEEHDDDAGRMALESEYFSALGLGQRAVTSLRELCVARDDPETGERAAEFMGMLDRLVFSFAEDALKSLKK